jgi:transcriptional regulator
MYIPKQFEETSIDVLHRLIQAKPLATLVTLRHGEVEANHIPLQLASTSELGVLSGHVARANRLWTDHPEDREVLVIFQGAESYITPSWYASKAETGKVVPTWNYITVHARGRLRVIHDSDWILSQLRALTDHNEAGFVHPWAVSDAPSEFTQKLLEAIVGIQIEITDLKGKWKISQNRSTQDRATVVAGLTNSGQNEMAELVNSTLAGESK